MKITNLDEAYTAFKNLNGKVATTAHLNLIRSFFPNWSDEYVVLTKCIKTSQLHGGKVEIELSNTTLELIAKKAIKKKPTQEEADERKRIRKNKKISDSVKASGTTKVPFTNKKQDINAPGNSKLDDYWEKNGIVIYGAIKRVAYQLPLKFAQRATDEKYLMEWFGIKGIQYGRWLNQEDRYNYLAGMAVAMYDLQRITGFPAKQMGLNKTLSFAFGARGTGAGIAHYEPLDKIINLNRYRRTDAQEVKEGKENARRSEAIRLNASISAMAHEYGHAIDYYFGLQVSKTALTRGRETTSDYIQRQNPLQQDMENLMAAILLNKDKNKPSAYYNRLKEYIEDKPKTGDYYLRRNEVFARAFELYVRYQLKVKGYTNKFLTETKYDRKFYLTDNELRSIIPLFDKLLNRMKNSFGVRAQQELEQKQRIPARLSGVVNSDEVLAMKFNTLPFKGRWLAFIGEPNENVVIMVHGSPGCGKSNFSLQFANYLTTFGRTLYVPAEEGMSYTLQTKLAANGVGKSLDLLPERSDKENITTALQSGKYKALIIDSINVLDITSDDIKNWQTLFPKMAICFVVQHTKDGKFLGSKSLEHLADAVILVEGGVAKNQKNRLGGSGEYSIFNS